MLLNASNKTTETEAILVAEQDPLPGSPTHLQASPAEGISHSNHHHRQAFLALHTLQLTALETLGGWGEREQEDRLYTPLPTGILILTPSWYTGEVIRGLDLHRLRLCLIQTIYLKKDKGPRGFQSAEGSWG